MYFRLHVTPGARRDAVRRSPGGLYKVNVREPARSNLANKRALNLLAEELKVPAKNLRVMLGHRRPHKIVYLQTPHG